MIHLLENIVMMHITITLKFTSTMMMTQYLNQLLVIALKYIGMMMINTTQVFLVQ